MAYDPEHYLESTVRELKNYIEANVNTRIYQVVMEFPAANADSFKMPVRRTIIHLELDAQDDRFVGFSDRPMSEEYNATAKTVTPRWAGWHQLNFDVGVWASDDSGGVTARLRAKQILQQLFGYPSSVQALLNFTDGGNGAVEIVRYTGGAFAQDRIADVRLYRMINSDLEVRVFSRTPAGTPGPSIETITQSPNLTILG